MKTIGGLLLVVVLGWYFFVDTLSLRELSGKPTGSIETILINLVDFDTGLTRYDVYRLKDKAPYWEQRIREVRGIGDMGKRDEEDKRLLAEMMEDPVLKKVTKGVFGAGSKAVLSILHAIS
jgi:hypothetical protein